MRLDIESGARERFSFGNDTVVEEHVLVPKPGSTREGDGWLVGMGYDVKRQRSFLSVFDAMALAAGPGGPRVVAVLGALRLSRQVLFGLMRRTAVGSIQPPGRHAAAAFLVLKLGGPD